MKIFKYRIENGFASYPENAIVIRTDHVDDGFYFGDFLWAIVEPGQENVRQKVDRVGWSLAPKPDVPLNKVQIAVKEKQIIRSGTPVYAHEDDGKIYVYCLYDTVRNHEIAVYKTGQQIDVNISDYTYIGLNRLWIIQELGLYTFTKPL